MDQRRDATDVGGVNDTPNMSSTTAPLTPQQMRELADEEEKASAYMAQLGFDTGHEDAITVALRAAADQLEAVQVVVRRYAGWYEDGPEDSWRFERDLRVALGMEQYDGGDDD